MILDIEHSITENVVAFAWEPIGNKFAIIHGDGPQTFFVSFYGIKSGSTVSLMSKSLRTFKSCANVKLSLQKN